MTDDERLEAAAQAGYRAWYESVGLTPRDGAWEQMAEAARDQYRATARAAILEYDRPRLEAEAERQAARERDQRWQTEREPHRPHRAAALYPPDSGRYSSPCVDCSDTLLLRSAHRQGAAVIPAAWAHRRRSRMRGPDERAAYEGRLLAELAKAGA